MLTNCQYSFTVRLFSKFAVNSLLNIPLLRAKCGYATLWNTHTHNYLMALCLGLSGWAGTRRTHSHPWGRRRRICTDNKVCFEPARVARPNEASIQPKSAGWPAQTDSQYAGSPGEISQRLSEANCHLAKLEARVWCICFFTYSCVCINQCLC